LFVIVTIDKILMWVFFCIHNMWYQFEVYNMLILYGLTFVLVSISIFFLLHNSHSKCDLKMICDAGLLKMHSKSNLNYSKVFTKLKWESVQNGLCRNKTKIHSRAHKTKTYWLKGNQIMAVLLVIDGSCLITVYQYCSYCCNHHSRRVVVRQQICVTYKYVRLNYHVSKWKVICLLQFENHYFQSERWGSCRLEQDEHLSNHFDY